MTTAAGGGYERRRRRDDARRQHTFAKKVSASIRAALPSRRVAAAGDWAAPGTTGPRTGEVLESLPEGFVVLNDLELPAPHGPIDHVVIGPTGAFTVETKDYASAIVVDRGRATTDRRALDRAVQQAQGQAAALSEAIGVPASPVICAHGGLEVGLFAKLMVDGVRFTTEISLAKALTSGEPVFDDAEVEALVSPDGPLLALQR